MTGHAKLGPSAAKRWMTCPGSTRLLEGIPDPGSEPAAMGTFCHAELAKLLRETFNIGRTFEQLTPAGTTVTVEGFTFEYTAEMESWVYRVASWVCLYMELHPKSRLLIEHRSPVGEAFGHPDLLWGTADIVIINDEEHELVVADAKFGFEEVECAGNEQVSLYGIGMLHRLGWEHFDSVELAILQPRSPEPEKTELLTVGEMQDRKRSYEAAVERAVRYADAPLVPADDACRWCRAAGRCPALNAEAAILADDAFAQPELLPLDALLGMLRSADRVRLHLKRAAQYVEQQLALGMTVPGWKLVRSNKHRQWMLPDSKVAEALFLIGATPSEVWEAPGLRSPAQIEKTLKVKLPEGLAAKPEGEPTLAPESDPRDALASELTPAYTVEAADEEK